MIADHFYWLVSVSIVAAIVTRQLIREQLVASLIKNKHYLSQEISSWVTSGSGYIGAIKSEYIWGQASGELLVLPYARLYVLAFRLIDVIGVTLLLLAMSFFIYDLQG